MEPDLECHPCAFGVECAHEHMCRFSVTPEAVFGQVWCSLGRECSLDGADSRVWKAGFNADGFMELSSLSGSDVSGRGRWIAMQRWFYRRFLDGESMDGCQGARLTVDSAMQASLQTTFGECAEYLFLLQQQAMLLARNPRPVLKEKFLATWQQLQNILNENKYLNVLALLWQFESQQQGHDLDGLVRIINRYHSLILGMQQSL